MSSNEFLEIRYDAFPCNDSVEDLKDIESFKEEINKNYNNIVKANSVGRGGGAYEFVIHFICNLRLSDYLNNFVLVYLANKVIDKATDKSLEKYLFTPLQNAYQKLKEVNPILDCYSFRIELEDINIFIHKTSDNSILPNLEKIIKEIPNHLKNIEIIESFKTTEIHIPAILDTVDGQKLYRAPLGIEETITTLSHKDYFKFWGVKYCSNQLSTVYNLSSKSILSDYSFYTEEEFLVIFRKEK
jgi:hypothetical protein